MTEAWVLGQRALREGWRTPEALLPTLFIPLFFLVVNVGQAAKIFPGETTDFLHGQGYGAFQLPSSLMRRTSSQTVRRLAGSRPVVGSSRNSTSGWWTSADARSSRRRIPPE